MEVFGASVEVFEASVEVSGAGVELREPHSSPRSPRRAVEGEPMARALVAELEGGVWEAVVRWGVALRGR